MAIFGVDVSHWQKDINWADVAESGIQFATHKATEGHRSVDSRFRGRFDDMRQHFPLCGAYHFLRRHQDSPIDKQVDHFIDVVAEFGGYRGLMVQLDVEEYQYEDPPHSGHWVKVIGPSYADVRDWLTRWNERTGRYPVMLYTGGWYWGGPRIGDKNGAALGVPLWHSRYVFKEGNPVTGPYRTVWQMVPRSWWKPGYGGWTNATILQYSSRATVPGVSGVCDVNHYLGTIDELRAIATEGDDMPLTQADAELVATRTWVRDSDPDGAVTEAAWIALHNARRDAAACLAQITELRRELTTGRDPIDTQEIITGLLAELTPSAIADAVVQAMSADQARETAEALQSRIGSTSPPVE